MSLRSILDALQSIPPLRRIRANGRRPGFRPWLEPLDGRCMPSFSPITQYAVGTSPQAVVTGDFDNDGDLDLVTAITSDGTVSVLPGDGQGGFGTPSQSPAVGFTTSVAVGDFNSDGKLDLATANPGGAVIILPGNGDGTFGTPTSFGLSDGSSPLSVAVGDFNADGKLDLGVASNYYHPGFGYYGYYGGYYWHPGYETGAAHVLIGDGLGGFTDAGGMSLGYAYLASAVVADLNGDGKQDFATVDLDNGWVYWLAGDGLGDLGGPNGLYPGGGAWDVVAGDVNGDGKNDLVTANRWSDNVGVLLGNGLGGFQAQAYGTGSYTAGVALADFNHDGNTDIAAATDSSGVAVLLGRGNGTFTPPVMSAVGVGSYPQRITAGDFNKDGWSDAATANSGDDTASVLINDHSWVPPNAPSVSINDVSVTEGNTGSVNATFTLTLSAASTQPVTVHYQTSDGGATAGSDYTAGSGDVTIPAGLTTQTFTVPVLGDRLPEPSENFFVNLSGPTNGFISDGQGAGTIVDNEPRITINDVTVTEGNTGSLNATLKVSLSVAYDQAVTVHYVTANGSATAGSDYTGITDTTLTIPAGQLSQTFNVAVLGDRVAESTENFVVNLSSPSSNALISDAQGSVTILDNEPRITINDVSKKEGNGTTQFVFTVRLSVAYDQTVTVNFATANGTATVANGDYVAASGTLTFAPGVTTKTITVSVKGDKKKEPDEWFAVNLSGASTNALISDSQGLGWILNDDKNH